MFEELSDAEALKALFKQRNAIDAEIQRRLSRFDKTEGYAADGSLTAKALLRWNCNLTFGQASDRVEMAREMESLPVTAEALSAGDISYQHAALIARTKQRLGCLWPPDAEEILVTAAKQMNPTDLRRATMQLQHCLQPDGVLDDANAADDRRFLHLNQTFGGIFVLNGQFGADDGGTLKAALMSVLKPPAEGDNRTPGQRRADALIDLVKNGPRPRSWSTWTWPRCRSSPVHLARRSIGRRSQFQPTRRDALHATARSRRSSTARCRAPRDSCPGGCARLSTPGMSTAAFPAATCPRFRQTPITSCTGPTAVPPSSST